MMNQIFTYIKKNILIIAIVFSLGAFTGYKILESIGMAALIANIPIPEGSIAVSYTHLTLPTICSV